MAVAVHGREPIPTIGGVEAWKLVYRFADDKLFEIATFVAKKDFSTVEQGFNEKYGPPTISDIERFQNGYGAVFQGAHRVWNSNRSAINIHEITTENDSPVSKIAIYDKLEFNEYYGIKTNTHPGKDM